jgi:UDP-glucuronate 4-epimerase
MALFKFAEAIMAGQPIDVYNHGQMTRDFTYIDDIVEGVVRLAIKPAQVDASFDAESPDAGRSSAPWRIFNIGNGQPTLLMDYITALETALGREAKKNFLEMQPGDVMATSSDTQRLDDWVGFKPDTPIGVGVAKFVEWYVAEYNREQA